jgi:hypothetical protein
MLSGLKTMQMVEQTNHTLQMFHVGECNGFLLEMGKEEDRLLKRDRPVDKLGVPLLERNAAHQ